MTTKYAHCLNCTIVYIVGESEWAKTSLELKDFLRLEGSHSSHEIAAAISCPKCKDYKFSPGWKPDMVLQGDYYYTL